jgi:gluconolactonase
MTNGGTGPFNGNLILINSGRGTIPPTIALVDPKPPHNATVILNNFYGRQFNSLNDIKVHPTSGNLFFTDTMYVGHSTDTPVIILKVLEQLWFY